LRSNEHLDSYIARIGNSGIFVNYYTGANYLEYLLDGDYVSFSGTIFIPEDAPVSDVVATLAIYGDGKLLREVHIARKDILIDFSQDIAGCRTIRLEWYRSDFCDVNLGIGMSNFTVTK